MVVQLPVSSALKMASPATNSVGFIVGEHPKPLEVTSPPPRDLMGSMCRMGHYYFPMYGSATSPATPPITRALASLIPPFVLGPGETVAAGKAAPAKLKSILVVPDRQPTPPPLAHNKI